MVPFSMLAHLDPTLSPSLSHPSDPLDLIQPSFLAHRVVPTLNLSNYRKSFVVTFLFYFIFFPKTSHPVNSRFSVQFVSHFFSGKKKIGKCFPGGVKKGKAKKKRS